MGHFAVFKATHYMGDGISFADIGEELVAQTLALGCTGHEASDIGELHAGGHHLLRLGDFCQRIKPRVWHWHDAGVGLNSAEGKVFRGDARAGECVEQGGLAHIG